MRKEEDVGGIAVSVALYTLWSFILQRQKDRERLLRERSNADAYMCACAQSMDNGSFTILNVRRKQPGTGTIVVMIVIIDVMRSI